MKNRFTISILLMILSLSPFICRSSEAKLERNNSTPIELEFFKINGVETRFIYHQKFHLLVSPSCLIEKNHLWEKNEACQAINKLKTVSLKKLSKDLLGGANPGSVACLSMGGQTFIAVDSHLNQNSFCKFQDGSWASSGTIHYHAVQNDK